MKKHIKSKCLDMIVRKSAEFKRKYAFSDIEFIGIMCILLQLYSAIVIGGICITVKAIIGFLL